MANFLPTLSVTGMPTLYEPNTIVLIHDLWMTPRSWEHFNCFYQTHGYRVLTPAWPGTPGGQAMARHPMPASADLGFEEIAAHYDRYVRTLHEPVILMGHGFGGLIVQMLLDRGLGAAGVAIAPVPPRGVLRAPPSMVRVYAPILASPANRHRLVELTFARFRYAFANTMTKEQARAAYVRYAVPGPGRPVFQAAFGNLNPWSQTTKIQFTNNYRAPLLLIAGSNDHPVPSPVVRDNYKQYERSEAITDYQEFAGRSHLLIAQEGWQEVAGYALSWAKAKVSEALLAV